jgi:hypothetical protein
MLWFDWQRHLTLLTAKKISDVQEEVKPELVGAVQTFFPRQEGTSAWMC